MPINLHHLEVFAAVARAGSVTRGADALAISQPAVSKQLRELERSLRTTLVDRHPKGVELTAAGRVLADYARRIFSLAAEAQQAVEDLSLVRTGRLNVGAGPTVGVYLLPRAIVQFRRRFPDVRLNIETGGPQLLGQRLADGALDFALTESPLAGTEIESKTFAHDVLVPIAPAAHPPAKRRTVSAEEFARQPFIARQTESGEKSLVERTLAARKLDVQPILTVASTEAMKQAVIAGVGVSIVSRLAIQTELAARQLVELPIPRLAIRYSIQLIKRRGRSDPAAAKPFLEVVRNCIEM
jgi:DNA-binding transcriptional LysR family regulator